MGLLKGPLKKRQSIEQVVYSEDPGVKAPEHRKGCGWFPRSEALGVQSSASIVTIQGLEADELNRLDDEGGMNAQLLAAARAGVVDCNEVEREPGKHLGEALKVWLDCLVFDNLAAARLLGLRIITVSKNHDPETAYQAARKMFGVGVADGASKSPDGS